MLRSRAIPGSLAAVTAAVCVLGLASPATGAVAVLGGLLQDRVRCCSPAAAGEGIASVANSPAERHGLGEWASAALVPASHSPRGFARAAVTLAQSAASDQPNGAGNPDETQSETIPSDKDEAESGKPREQSEPWLQEIDPNFAGSAKPAGPDLTLSEEKRLISNGWK